MSMSLVLMLCVFAGGDAAAQDEQPESFDYPMSLYLQADGSLIPSANATAQGRIYCPNYRFITGGGSGDDGTARCGFAHNGTSR